LPGPSEDSSSGFGYPLDDLTSSSPWKPLSASDAHGLSPSELFSSLVVERSFRILPSVLALRSETFVGFRPVLQRLTPTRKAVPLISLPEGLVQVGALALLGLLDLSGSPSLTIHEKSFSLFSFPFRPFSPPISQSRARRTLRVSDRESLALSLRKGRRPVWPFSPLVPHLLFNS